MNDNINKLDYFIGIIRHLNFNFPYYRIFEFSIAKILMN